MFSSKEYVTLSKNNSVMSEFDFIENFIGNKIILP